MTTLTEAKEAVSTICEYLNECALPATAPPPATPGPLNIDFNKIRRDTLVHVKNNESPDIIPKYFSHVGSDGHCYCFAEGGTRNTSTQGVLPWSIIRLADNNKISWPGGDCPLPDGVTVTIQHRNGDEFTGILPFGEASRWEHYTADTDIINYQIKASQWQGESS